MRICFDFSFFYRPAFLRFFAYTYLIRIFVLSAQRKKGFRPFLYYAAALSFSPFLPFFASSFSAFALSSSACLSAFAFALSAIDLAQASAYLVNSPAIFSLNVGIERSNASLIIVAPAGLTFSGINLVFAQALTPFFER